MKKSEIKDLYNASKDGLTVIKAKCMVLPFAKDIDNLAEQIAEQVQMFFPVVKQMCDYMIDDGSTDMSERLQEIDKEFRLIEKEVAKLGYSKKRFVLLQNCRAIINNIKDVDIWGAKPHLNPSNDAGGQLQGNDQNKPLGAEEMPINKDMLPTIGDEETKELEQRVFLKLIEAGFMSLNADNSGYTWKQSNYDLAFLCGCIYWGDEAKENKTEAYKCNYTKDCYYLDKSTKRLDKDMPDGLRELFSGKDVPDYKYHYKKLSQSPKWKEIDKLLKEAMAEVKAGK